ncbi:MAG: hypothetical protein JW861_12045 [Bacteroidales bacterium]|nr:hypothetical protein [Bacteroidales bacterium]
MKTTGIIVFQMTFLILYSGVAILRAQDFPTDTVCAGANEYYKVLPTPGSTYTWRISSGGTPTYGVDIKNDSIRIAWANTNTMVEDFVKVVETNKYGRSGDTITLRILRFPAPTATISGSDTLYDGNNGTDKILVTLTGTPPWDIVYNDGRNNIPVENIESSPYSIQTRPLSNPPEVHSFTLISVKNKSGCAGSVSGAANIVVSPPIKTSNIIHN